MEIDLRNVRHIFGHDIRITDCVINVIKDVNDNIGNLLTITCELRVMGMISEENYQTLIQMHRQDRDLSLKEYILRLSMMISFEDLCLILDKQGHHAIVLKLQEVRYTIMYRKPRKREILFVKFINKYYKNLKSQIDNNCFTGGKHGIRVIVRALLAKWDETIASSQSTNDERELALEKKAVGLVLLMQQYKNPKKRESILSQALQTETNGCDNTSLQIVCLSKLACTEVFRKNKDTAKEYMKQAQALSENISPCFAVMSALHDFILMKRIFLSNEQSGWILDDVTSRSESALLCMFEEQEEVQNMWKRIILQFEIMSLLGIELDFKVKNNSIAKENVAKANELLHEIDKSSQGIEKRRQMIKSLCHGVVYEMQKNFVNAQAFLEEAVDIARDGGCFHSNELKNIEEYRAHLSAQTFPKYLSS